MLDIIRGGTEKEVSTQQLIEELQKIFTDTETEGFLYIGYPILNTVIGGVSLDAVIITPEHGVILFDLIEGIEGKNRSTVRDELYSNMQSRLIQYPELRNGRDLAVGLEVLTYAPQVRNSLDDSADYVDTFDKLSQKLLDFKDESNAEKYKSLISVIQLVTKLSNSRKRSNVKKDDSRGAKLIALEASIANLDSRQNRAVIETVDGPQRIRGLAGSGKTIILALKATYLHTKYPEWNIAITFNTRSLKDQFIDLVNKFTIETKHEEPDWEKLKVMQSWGSHSSVGIYYDFCLSNGLEPLDFRTAKSKAPSNVSALGYACLTALKEIKDRKIIVREKYDAILIDEAQDLSSAFLTLCHVFLKSPKRIIWAYDELQNLSMLKIKSPKELFGKDLGSDLNEAHQDIILEKCYRNSRPVLVTAHGLGFGTVREGGLVQMFDEPTLWKEIGYELESGSFSAGENVVLKRTPQTSPTFLEKHSPLEDLIKFEKFDDRNSQAVWIAENIARDLRNEELNTRDIIVVSLNPLTVENDTSAIRTELFKLGINSHISGVTTSPDHFFKEDSVAFTGIYRAKGNEAPMVYVVNSEYAFHGAELIRKRNMLFSAITRSKAWVRVVGCGEGMVGLIKEYIQIRDSEFKLTFTYPTSEEMENMSLINRDLSESEKSRKKKSLEEVNRLASEIKQGTILADEVDPSVRDQLSIFFSKKNE